MAGGEAETDDGGVDGAWLEPVITVDAGVSSDRR